MAPQTKRTLSRGPAGFQERPGGTQDEPRWDQRELTKAQDGRVGLKMGPTWPKIRQHGPKGSLTWPRKAPRWPSRSQDGANMAPRWPKMRQHGPQGSLTWLKKTSRSGQVGAKMGPRWSQHGTKMPRIRQHGLTHAPILKNLRFPAVFHNFRGPERSLRWTKREPKSSQDGQVGAKMAQESAKIGPRWPSWSQDGANMAPRWPKMRQPEPA